MNIIFFLMYFGSGTGLLWLVLRQISPARPKPPSTRDSFSSPADMFERLPEYAFCATPLDEDWSLQKYFRRPVGVSLEQVQGVKGVVDGSRVTLRAIRYDIPSSRSLTKLSSAKKPGWITVEEVQLFFLGSAYSPLHLRAEAGTFTSAQYGAYPMSDEQFDACRGNFAVLLNISRSLFSGRG